MFVIKRSGIKENVQFDKITSRLQKLLYGGLEKTIDPAIITQKICSRMSSGITTTELDNLASQICMGMIIDNPDFGILGARIVISNHQKNTDDDFLFVVTELKNNKDIQGNVASLVSDELYDIVLNNKEFLQNMIVFDRDYLLDFFGFKTLERSYLLKVNEGKIKRIVERPQHLFLRVAIGIHGDDFESVKKTYDNMSLKIYTHATPTLFNAGTPHSQLSSCFLAGTEDSVEGIFETMTDCAKISKWSGGIGLHISNIRANGSYIRKTAGTSDGIIPMLKVYNDIARYINQCFGPDTIVYTINGPKKISNITNNDLVITIDGSPKKVLGVKKSNINKNILKIKSTYSADFVSVTKEHQIYVLRDQKKINHKVIINRLEKNIIKCEYISAGELNTNDILCYPIPKIDNNFIIDNDIARFYGILLGDGHLTKHKTYNSINAAVTCGPKKFDTILFVKNFLNKLNIHWGEHKENENKIRLSWSWNGLQDKIGIYYDDIYDNDDNDEKKISSRFLKMNNENTFSMIKGLIDTDGHIGNEIYFYSSSQNLIESVRYCLLKLGILTSGYNRNRIGQKSSYKNITTRKIEYVLRIPKDKILCEILKITPSKKLGYFRYKDTLYSRIKNIKEYEYSGFVYDLNIQDNHNYLTQMGLVHNSGKRNGSFAVYLEPHHADVIPFLEARKNVGPEEIRARDLFYALWVSDYFMECIEKNQDWYLMDPDQSYGLNEVYGDEYTELYKRYVSEGKFMKKIKARELWEHIIASQIEHGMPYISYKDHVNRKNNQKHYGTIKSSNLCVSGDTMILTKNGYFPIKSLEKQNIEVWNGKEWSKTVAKKTGEDQKLLKVKFTNGLELKCTEYHKFYIESGRRPTDKSIPIIVEAKDLKKDMRIIRFETDVANDNDNHLKYAYTHGLYCADGTYSNKNIDTYRCIYKKQDDEIFCGRHLNHVQKYFTKDEKCCADCYSDKPLLSLYKEKIKLLDYIDTIGVGKYIEKSDKMTVSLPYDIEKKYYVPINNSIDSKIKWLEGYFDGDACIIENDGVKNIQFASNNLNFIREIIYLLQTLGITAQIKTMSEEGFKLLPDGKGGEKLYPIKKSYRSSIDSVGLNKLINMGFSPKRLDVSNSRLPHHKTNMFIKIDDVIDEDIYEDTYCFNEPLEHKGIFNGIITGQCNEINEYSDKDETAVCNLGSICLPKILEYPFSDAWRELSQSQSKLISIYEDRDRVLKLYSKSDCDYCKLLKALLKSCGLSYIEIDEEEAESLRNPDSKPFETVPQLFSVKDEDIVYLGGYNDNWEILSPRINYKKLYELAYEITVNLNKVIDINYYPTEKTRISNMKHRPIGLGVQGLADVFMTLKIPFTSDEAREINKEIFETIYFGSMSASVDLAKRDGYYPTYIGSPLSEGKFQYNLWGLKDVDLSGRWKWGELRNNLLKYGSRNSLNIALMPTASTASIFGNVESFEAITSNLYTRNVLSGVFTMINKYLIQDLIDLEIWNQDTKDRLIYNKGSVQNLKALPNFLREIYKTSFEIEQKLIIKMSAERGVFVCQSQSLNLFFDKPTFKDLTACHFYGWKNGLKTGSYYIRTRSALSGQNFGLDPKKEKQLREEKIDDIEDEGCLSCGA